MDITTLDAALAIAVTLCGIAGSTLIGIVAIFYMDGRQAPSDV